jgi:uncharacterized peroxidase-related enzyme
MPHIYIPSGLPGITGLLEARLDSAEPIRELTQTILRGPNTLTEGERELLASIVCERNACRFCTAAHVTTAARYVGSVPVVREILADPHGGHVSERIAALLDIAGAVQASGRDVTPSMIDAARTSGATDVEIHDAVLIAALFAFYNRYVDGLATDLPSDDAYFDSLADRLTTAGYVRRPQHGTH